MLSDKFVTKENILIAIQQANNTLSNPHFYELISRQQFDQTISDARYIANQLKSFFGMFEVNVREYRSTWFYRNVNAYVLSGDHLNIYINTYHNRTWQAMYETICHEIIHCVDVYDVNGDYGHGDNDPSGDENAAPNKIGRLAVKFIGESPRGVKTKIRRKFYWYLNPRNWF